MERETWFWLAEMQILTPYLASSDAFSTGMLGASSYLHETKHVWGVVFEYSRI
jgi:hypothetical protein